VVSGGLRSTDDPAAVEDEDGGFPLWGWVAVGGGLIVGAGTAIGVVAARRRRPELEDEGGG
jgi:hypothetical protein